MRLFTREMFDQVTREESRTCMQYFKYVERRNNTEMAVNKLESPLGD